MLPLPHLDDQTYKQIFENAKKMIPRISPSWTDENYHDPGITFLQMFAWLKEMQQYYLDQIGDHSRLKFLKLLGCSPKEAVPARAKVQFEGIPENMLLPKGLKLLANDISFETMDEYLLLKNRIRKIVSLRDSKQVDISNILFSKDLSEYLFGSELQAGNRLYIGFENQLPSDKTVSLAVGIFSSYPVKRNEFDKDSFDSLADLTWEYYGETGWRSIKIIDDETCSFIKDGCIRFELDGSMIKGKADLEDSQDLYWIRCTIYKCSYDIAPRLKSLDLNRARVVQKDTSSEVLEFSGDGNDRQLYALNTYLSQTGKIEVQVKQENGLWKFWSKAEETHLQQEELFRVEVHRDDNGILTKYLVFDRKFSTTVPTEGRDNIRVICFKDRFMSQRYLSGSTGLPGQEYETGIRLIKYGNFRLQIGKPSGDGAMLWEDWKQVEDFDASKAQDRHYTLQASDGKIRFGDDEHGLIPYSAKGNILIIACSTCEGLEGNVKSGEINQIDLADGLLNEKIEEITVRNFSHAVGGRDEESIEEAVLSVRSDLDNPGRAVTLEDFENIVKKTPGLMIHKVKALCDRNIKLVVKPYCEDKRCVLSDTYIKNIKRYLDQYRLITTEVSIVSPEYTGIDIYGEIVVKPHFGDARNLIKKAILDYFGTLEGAGGDCEWDFGRTVQYGEIYGRIEALDCVGYIASLSLSAQGKGVTRNVNGDIEIPPNGLVYLKDYEVMVKE